MCGIGSVKFLREPVDRELICDMILETEKRGQDAFGIVNHKKAGAIEIFKRPGPAHSAMAQPAFLEFLMRVEPNDLLIWNCRAQPLTESASFDESTIQPIVRGNFTVSHNGVVANDEELCEEFDLVPTTPLDSEVPLMLFEKFGGDGIADLLKAFELVSGGFAYLQYDRSKQILHAVKDFKTLTYGENELLFFLISEEPSVGRLFGERLLPFWTQLQPYTVVEFTPSFSGSVIAPLKTKTISSLPPKDDNHVLVCSSGGIDSTAAAYLLKRHFEKEVTLCHVALGQKSEAGEWAAVQALAADLGSECLHLDMRDLGELGASVLTEEALEVPKAKRQNLKSTICWTPARNLAMVSMLAAVAEAKGAGLITAGWTLEEEGSYPDNSILFFEKFNELLDYGTLMRPKLVMPLARLMKSEIIQLGQWLKVPYELTYSCDCTPEAGKACGCCGACTLRRMAFEKAEVADPTEYLLDYKSLYVPSWMRDSLRPPRTSIAGILSRVIF